MFFATKPRCLGAIQKEMSWQEAWKLILSNPFGSTKTIFGADATDPQVLADDRVRATGINPATGKLISPIYAKAFSSASGGVDPNDPKAVATFMAKTRAEVLAQYQRDKEKFEAEKTPSGSINWWMVSTLGLGGIGVAVIAVKAFK